MTEPYFFWIGHEAEQFHEPLLVPVDTWQVDLVDPQTDE